MSLAKRQLKFNIQSFSPAKEMLHKEVQKALQVFGKLVISLAALRFCERII